MRRLIFILLLGGLICTAQAQIAKDSSYVHGFGVQVGVDIGGAIPTPVSYIPDIFNPYPKIYPSIGAKYTFALTPKWMLGGELTYKHVEMSADAMVENMQANLPDEAAPNGIVTQYYTGQANMNMAFDMLEIPLYGIYGFQNMKNKLIFGGYAAWIIQGQFKNTPLQGFIGSEPNQVDLIVNPNTNLPVEQTNFSKYLGRWDAGIIVGYEREIYKRINIGLRMSFGFKDIFDTQILEYHMLHVRGSIVVSYDLYRL